MITNPAIERLRTVLHHDGFKSISLNAVLELLVEYDRLRAALKPFAEVNEIDVSGVEYFCGKGSVAAARRVLK